MSKRRKLEHQEITRKNKDNSADILDAWGLVDETDRLIDIAMENGEPEYYEGLDVIGVRSVGVRGLQGGPNKAYAKTHKQELEELYELLQTGKYVVKWYKGFCVLERTFNVNQESYNKYVEEKNKEE